MTFEEFVSTPLPLHEKYQRMVDLMPYFEMGVINGRSITEMCDWLSQNDSEFQGMTSEKVNRLYRYVRAKCGFAKPEKVNPLARISTPKKGLVEERRIAIPTPTPIAAPVVPVVHEPIPASENPAPIEEVAKPAETEKPVEKIPLAEAVRKHLSMSPAEMHRAASEAEIKFKGMAKECGDWAQAQGYLGVREKELSDITKEWMHAEPGRREMIQEMARAIYTVRGSSWMDKDILPDSVIDRHINRAGLYKRYADAIYAAEHPGWVPAVAA